MRLELRNFGQFECRDFTLTTHVQAPNGWGKTTLINAYIFALSGRTINGFEPRRVGFEHENTSVTLRNFGNFNEVRRVLSPKGTTLYVNGDVMTQTQFSEIVNVPLAVACADVTILADSALTTEDLRRLLILTNVMDATDTQALRKEQKRVRDAKRVAEQYALSNVVVPPHTINRPTEAELDFMERFGEMEQLSKKRANVNCPMCGSAIPEHVFEQERERIANAMAWVGEHRAEYDRLVEQRLAYEQEENEINAAKMALERASRAREDVQRLTQELADLDAKIREADESAINASLPDDVIVATEQTTKSGKTSSTCALYYKGVPLKSVNYAQRVHICVWLLNEARKTALRSWLPIIVDNAESVTGLRHYPNLITLNVA